MTTKNDAPADCHSICPGAHSYHYEMGDVREAAEAAGIPNDAGMRIIVDRVANPTPLDRGNDPVIEFTWELARREYPE